MGGFLLFSINQKVAIVLLNYNGYKDTIGCFESLQAITYSKYNVIIVDNDSPDNSMENIADYMSENNIEYISFDSTVMAMNHLEKTPKVTLIKSSYNGGYGHGNNIGIKYALNNGADYILVLNNDTVVEPDFLEPMVQMCENDKNIGIASGKIYFYDRPDTIWFNGGKFSPCTAKVEHFNFNEKDVGQIPQEPVTFISGCMWLIPKKVFEDVGFINEEYFMYVEDLEFCQRVLKKGYTLDVIKKGNVYHKVGGITGGKYSSFSVFWRTKNMNKLISTMESKLCRLSAYMIFNFKTIVQLIRAKKISLLKDVSKAIFSFKKDINVT